MSWVKSVSSSEDVFDEDADDTGLQSKEWKLNMKKRVKDGYRDGVDAGKEASLQVGFNLGYKEGAALTVPVGRLKGILCAIQCWCQLRCPNTPVPPAVTDLLQRVTRCEDALVGRMLEALESAPPSVSEVSESMEDLGVNGGDPGCSGEADCCRGGGGGGGEEEQSQNLISGSSDCRSSPAGSLDLLLQRCVDLVSELGLPQQLIQDLVSLKSVE